MSDRTVTIDLEPIRWHGSPLLVWMLAFEAWVVVGILVVVVAVR